MTRTQNPRLTTKLRARVIALTLLLPAVTAAQRYEKDKLTTEADKYIGLAMTRHDPSTRTALYQQALDALRPAMAGSSDNARIWLTAGIAYIGLERYVAADVAFDKAAALSPRAGPDIEVERAAGWLQAFRTGTTLLDNQQVDAALQTLEGAEALYDKRPEGVLNIATIYAGKGDHDRAEDAFRRALAAVQGELYAGLDSAVQAVWRGYAELATVNIAQLRAVAGNAAFAARNFDAAAAAYQTAREVNPHSRDYAMNHVQSLYSRAIGLEDAVKADPTLLRGARAQLLALYGRILTGIPDVRAFDPANVNLLLIQADVAQHDAELRGDAETGRLIAAAIVQEADSMPVEVADLRIRRDGDTVRVSGKVRNKTLAANTPVTLRVTLIGWKGQELGQVTVIANTVAKNELTPFELSAPVTGLVAGWKYEVVLARFRLSPATLENQQTGRR